MKNEEMPRPKKVEKPPKVLTVVTEKKKDATSRKHHHHHKHKKGEERMEGVGEEFPEGEDLKLPKNVGGTNKKEKAWNEEIDF